jgi:hypothetical protein
LEVLLLLKTFFFLFQFSRIPFNIFCASSFLKV